MTPMHLGPGTPPFQCLDQASGHPIELVLFDWEFRCMSNHVFRLLERHQKLDDLLRRAQAGRYSNPFEIARLKKLKLAIKDRLARLVRSPTASH